MKNKEYGSMSNLELVSALEMNVGELYNLNLVNLKQFEFPTDDETFFANSYWPNVKDGYKTLAEMGEQRIPDAIKIYNVLEQREKDYRLSIIDGC